jgi:cell division transport system ATP-binding protein
MIRLYRVTKIFAPRFTALADVSLEIAAGDLVFLTGPSGAGKTTLLRLLLGAERPTQGQILIEGRNLARLGRRGVTELQDAKLLPAVTVLDNVAVAAEAIGEPRRAARSRAFALLRELGLKDLVDRAPPSLSTGEQQRVALARALVNRPALLLADEPTGNLDEESADRVVDLLRRAHERGTTVLVATHDRRLLDELGGRVVSLRRGRVVGGDGEPDDAGEAASEPAGEE